MPGVSPPVLIWALRRAVTGRREPALTRAGRRDCGAVVPLGKVLMVTCMAVANNLNQVRWSEKVELFRFSFRE